MVDIIDIKNAVKRGEILFFMDVGRIYCEDVESGERVIVQHRQFKGSDVRADIDGCVREETGRADNG